MDTCVTVSQAARIKKVTRQAIYLAIKLKRLRAYRHDDTWKIFIKDLNDYDSKRYSREHHSDYDGKPLFDEQNGYFSVDKCSELTKIPKQKLYYAIRTGRLKADRKRCAWIVHVDDLFAYQNQFVNKDLIAEKAS